MTPDLSSYDYIVVNSSAGKDSQAMLDVVVERARKEGILGRVLVVHCDLGRVEWPGTRELAEEHARHYGLRFEVVSRPQGDLLQHIRERGKFPGPATRFCTSDHKTSQVRKLFTQLTREAGVTRKKGHIRILTCLGLRADESAERAKKPVFCRDTHKGATNSLRTTDIWLPIHHWTEDQVWWRIMQAGTRHHWAYDLGMRRLSCRFCIYATREDLLTAGRHNPELLEEYVQLEAEINHRFQDKLSLAEIKAELKKGGALTCPQVAPRSSWEIPVLAS